MEVIRKLIEYYFRNMQGKVPFTLLVFETLVLEGRLVLWPTRQVPGNKDWKS